MKILRKINKFTIHMTIMVNDERWNHRDLALLGTCLAIYTVLYYASIHYIDYAL